MGHVDEKRTVKSQTARTKLNCSKDEYDREFIKLTTEYQELENLTRKVPIQELERLQREERLGKTGRTRKKVCVSPAVTTQKSDGSIKIALEAKEFNKRIVGKRKQMPCLENLKNPIPRQI